MPQILTAEEIRARVVEILRRDLKLGSAAKIDDDMSFFNSEADLDSLDILLLVASVEKSFGIKIANEEVGQSAFQNVRSLTKFIATQLDAKAIASSVPPQIDYLARLPHGDSFRFISQITALKPGESAEGLWKLTGSEPFFAGHFPGRPIVPGVLIAEALAQLSGIVGAGANPGPDAQGSLAHVDVRFDRAVFPPAEILLKSKFVRQMGQLQQFDVAAETSGQTAARGTLALHRPDGKKVIALWLWLFFRLTVIAPALLRALKPAFVRLAWIFAPSIRRGTNANAQQIFDKPMNSRQLRGFSLAVIGYFYDFVLDVGLSLQASRDGLAQRIASVEGHDKYLAARASRRGAIILTAHMGSFEIGIATLTQMNERVHVVFRPDRIGAFEQLRRTLHQRLGVTEAALDDNWTVWLRLRSALQSDEVVAIQGDRVMPGQSGVSVSFLKANLLLPTGPVKLASASGAPIIPVFTIRASDGRLKIFVEEAIDIPHPLDEQTLQEAMLKIARVLEKYVAAYPEQWLVFTPAFR